MITDIKEVTNANDVRTAMELSYANGYDAACDDVLSAIRAEAAARFTDPESEFESVVARWEDVLRLVQGVKERR